MSDQRIKDFAKSISLKKASPGYSRVDADGNAVSNTYTLGYSFGSGLRYQGQGYS